MAMEFSRWIHFNPELDESLSAYSSQLSMSASSMLYAFSRKIEENVLTSRLVAAFEQDGEGDEKQKERFSNLFRETVDSTRLLDTYYLDLHHQLELMLSQKMTNGKILRILYLVDDLDRCLPGKAVEMLETIKLFLEVDGSAFIVAVDDEVVERGIARRYMDYQLKGASTLKESLINSPITGSEYLEKIIKLPVRIERPSEIQVESFIQERCPDLFELKQYLNRDKKPNLGNKSQEEQNSFLNTQRSHETFEQLMKAIPSVPRKLVRLSESFGLRKNILKLDKSQYSTLFRVVALQLFAPDVYRIATRKLNNIFGVLHEWKENSYKHLWPNFDEILKDRIRLEEELKYSSESQDKMVEMEGPELRKTWEQIYKPLLEALIHAQQTRSGFDPADLLNDWSPIEKDWRKFFGESHGMIVDPVKRTITNYTEGTGDMESDKIQVEIREKDFDEFTRNLLTKSESNWQQAGAGILENQKLGPITNGRLLKALQANLDTFNTAEIKRAWLQTNCRLFDIPTFERITVLLREPNFSNIKYLLAEKNKKKNPPAVRLRAADILGYLDKPEKGMGLNKKQLPGISWVDIPSGDFLYGDHIKYSAQEETCLLEGFKISKYPITTLQYQAFVNAGGYEQDEYWTDMAKINYEASPWVNPLRPKVNISWNEAVAFCRWLTDQLGYPVSLPDEKQWERAARGTDGKLYPWGNNYKSGLANVNEKINVSMTSELYLEQTSTVGLFSPEGDTADGIADLSGNVWEWCLNKYDSSSIIAPDDSNDPRILMGGGWDSAPVVARCTFRLSSPPDEHYGNAGFRVVRPLGMTTHSEQ